MRGLLRILVQAGELPQVKSGSIKIAPQVLVEDDPEKSRSRDVPTLQDVNLRELVKVTWPLMKSGLDIWVCYLTSNR